jgi:hypothetical protein
VGSGSAEPRSPLRGWDLGLELADGVSAADWVVAALRPWERPGDGDGPVWVASFVPDSYAAHARVLHPARDGRRWADLAAGTGVRIGPETGFCAVTGLDDSAANRPAWDEVVPRGGSLPAAQLAALGKALAPFTSTPQRCAFGFWIGYGYFGDQGDCELVRLPHREHFLFTGPLALTQRAFRFGVWEQSPSMWWPDDRAWFVSTDVDGYSTYVGGSAACIDAVLTCPGLEAIPVTPETPSDPGPCA